MDLCLLLAQSVRWYQPHCSASACDCNRSTELAKVSIVLFGRMLPTIWTIIAHLILCINTTDWSFCRPWGHNLAQMAAKQVNIVSPNYRVYCVIVRDTLFLLAVLLTFQLHLAAETAAKNAKKIKNRFKWSWCNDACLHSNTDQLEHLLIIINATKYPYLYLHNSATPSILKYLIAGMTRFSYNAHCLRFTENE